MEIFGILNITSDSFSDGGLYLEENSAREKAFSLFSEGADIIDIGAQSSNIHAVPIDYNEEITRIKSVLPDLHSRGIKVSIDTFRPEVIEFGIQSNVNYINNIRAFNDENSLEILKKYSQSLPDLILMYSHNSGEKASEKSNLSENNVLSEIYHFLNAQRERLISAGVPESRMIFDPGMGMFLGSDPSLSFEVLRQISQFKREFGRVMVSVSRKSFIGAILNGVPPDQRVIGSLALEIYLAESGVDFIRTHNPKNLKDAVTVRNFLIRNENLQ